MSDNPLNKHVPGHCPSWPTKDRLTESTRTEREEDLDAFGGRGWAQRILRPHHGGSSSGEAAISQEDGPTNRPIPKFVVGEIRIRGPSTHRFLCTQPRVELLDRLHTIKNV